MPKPTSVTSAKIPSKETRTLAQRHSTFEEAVARLNAMQRKAVEIIEGPVMVIAGPGTGKTQVTALRVAQILRKTQAKPANILCLTFSTSGATAMRDRLRSLIGSDAYGVTVSTIHGFCNDIIASHLILFEDWAAREQISDVERYRGVNKIIDQLLPDLQLVNKKYPHDRTKAILEGISLLKREGKTDRAFLDSVCDAFDLLKVEESKPGTKAHEKNLLAAVKFRDFVRIFLKYEEMLRATGRYDYDDMILVVLKALEEEDWLLAGLQERYQYILVDEFQDTNGAQYRLLELLTTPRSPEDNPNFFVVGDDDQAIYRFQGANLQNILSFHRRFHSAPVIVLATSYRCTQAILDAAGSLIEKNTERLVGRIKDLHKTMTSASGGTGNVPVLFHAASEEAERWLIADLIEDRLREGVAPQEIAVLMQTNGELRPLWDVLHARDIPVSMSGKVDLLTHPLVAELMTILRAAHRPEDGALASALACACFRCHPSDLGRLFDAARNEKKSLRTLLQELDAPESQASLRFYDQQSIVNAFRMILDLHQKIPSRTAAETVERALKDSGLLPGLSAFTKGEVDVNDFAALQHFFERLKQRLYEAPQMTFEGWMDEMTYYGHPEYSDLRLTYELPHLSDNGVQLLTAHRSKGLEFHTVILAHFREKHWDSRFGNTRISMPEDLLFGWSKDQKSFEKSQDERRVAYVAMTRAKRELLFTCPKALTAGDRQRSISPSRFFAEAGALKEEEGILRHPELASTLLLRTPRRIDAELRSFLLHRISNFSLSATALEHFLDDPQKFLELDLLQTPEIKKPFFIFGNAVHEALRHWALMRKQGEILSEEQFIARFSDYILNKEILTTLERERFLALGKETLPRYFATRLMEATPFIYAVEHPVTVRLNDPSHRDEAGIPLKGKIDRIDLLASDARQSHIIDYKTGAPKTEAQIRGDGKFRQLAFYSILLEKGLPHLEPISYTFDFVGEGAEHPVERTFVITEPEKRDMKKVIADVWSKILALDFTKL